MLFTITHATARPGAGATTGGVPTHQPLADAPTLLGVDLVAIDDSSHMKPTRNGMGPLVAVGGLHVPGDEVRRLELELDALCVEFGFPPDEEFKWSPQRDTWEHKNLHGDDRDEFNLRALGLAAEAGAEGIVVIEDRTKRRAVEGAKTPEEDVTLMFLERAHASVPDGSSAIAVFDRPGGGRKTENDFLMGTLARLRAGTTYASLDRLAMAVSTDSAHSRLVQLADIVVSCSTALVAGSDRYARKVFDEGVRPLLRSEGRRVGGVGLKIHPDFRYANLYHWLLGDETWWKGWSGVPLPSKGCTCYRESADKA